MKHTRRVSLALAALLLTQLFTAVSCGESQQNADEAPAEAQSTEAVSAEEAPDIAEEEEEERILPDLPDVKYNGAHF